LSVIDSILEGCIDIHVHCAPDPFVERREDALQLAYRAKQERMRAIVLKSHHYPTATIAYMVNQIVGEVQIIGSITLNREVGGLNPYAVEAQARLGAKMVWMPTLNSIPDMARRGEKGISLLDEAGELVSQVRAILEIAKTHRIVLGTGHISTAEVYALCEEVSKTGVKLTITHPLVHPETTGYGNHISIQEQKELVGKGAIIEHNYVSCMPFFERTDPMVIANAVRAVGVEHCILSTDFGQSYNPPAVEGARMMIAAMLKCGLSQQEVEALVKRNPARLLDLD